MASINPTSPQGIDAPTDEGSQYSYSNGSLTASTGLQLNDVDIVAVLGAQGNGEGYDILSLAPAPAPAEASTDADKKQRPFELRTTKATRLPQSFLEKHHVQALSTHLEPSHELRVIVSTLSGTGLALEFLDEILLPVFHALALDEARYNIVRTENTHSIIDLAKSTLFKSANEGKKQTVVVLSGDGGVVDIINGLLEKGERSRYEQHYSHDIPY
jgi:hypothetical protein